MILLNFAHPLTREKIAAIEKMTGKIVERRLDIAIQFDHEVSFLPQLEALLADLDLTPVQWQTAAIIINPPSLNFITALLLAELHGRMGYFPPVIRLRPVAASLPQRYEVAEILNLQNVRDAARRRRQEER